MKKPGTHSIYKKGEKGLKKQPSNNPFRGSADYMKTEEFQGAFLKLEHISLQETTD